MGESGRVEAFSDGVFAIAITLLVLEIKVPEGAADRLWSALGEQWPSYAAYAVTFLVIGIMWVNHHTVFVYIARVDRTLLFLNLLLLMGVAALPWPAGLLAAYLRDGHASQAAAIVYSAFMVYHALTFQALWWHLTRTGHLFRRPRRPRRRPCHPVPLRTRLGGLPADDRHCLCLRTADAGRARAAGAVLRVQPGARADQGQRGLGSGGSGSGRAAQPAWGWSVTALRWGAKSCRSAMSCSRDTVLSSLWTVQRSRVAAAAPR
ncbi:MAG: hypothetical protein JWL99_1499 [Streptomyces oryziradicis]|nr:hypothetical protein [Actinacidiphila oryziradicis]